MKLRKLEYSQFENTPRVWKIRDCTFGDINLIVGQNATGKTMTLNVIRGLADLLSELDELKWSEGHYDVEFDQDGELISYSLYYHEGEVTSERLEISSNVRMMRGSNGQGEIYAEDPSISKMIRFQVAPNRIAAFAKRDSIQHPFLEELYSWGKGLIRYDFGTPLGKDHLVVRGGQEPEIEERNPLNLKDTQKVVEVFLRGEKEYQEKFKNRIISDMRQIGYDLEDIGIGIPPGLIIRSNIPATPLGLYVKETDRQDKTYQHSMSQGMFRALSILIQSNYSLLTSQPSCILVDDIGEGLDFYRSSALIKLMIDKIGKSSSQLIMSTNDRFIMNNVPLEYWIILERLGEECIHHNYRNSKQMFDDFELTGLNNFDLFSGNYHLRNKLGNL